MPLLSIYLLKFSIFIAVIYVFYILILRKSTFYIANRIYFLTLLTLVFFIPLINVAPVIQEQEWTVHIPSTISPLLLTESFTIIHSLPQSSSISIWKFLFIIMITGSLVLLLRFIVQLLSFYRLRKKTTLIMTGPFNLYDLDEHITPFSFGKNIFVNRNLYSTDELQKVIRHEQVHAQQFHSIDTIWIELLCILNWFNPFIWLLRTVVRQNLEFIADDQLFASDSDKKSYQYLLLKIQNDYSYPIYNQFNFSSLKKRIKMMNKLKTQKINLLKFSIILPVIALILFAFKSGGNLQSASNNFTNLKTQHSVSGVTYAGIIYDSDSKLPLTNALVTLRNTKQTIYTDANGYFVFQLPINKREMVIVAEIQKDGYINTFSNNNINFSKDSLAFYGLVEFNCMKKTSSESKTNSESSTADLSFSDDPESINYESVFHLFQKYIVTESKHEKLSK